RRGARDEGAADGPRRQGGVGGKVRNAHEQLPRSMPLLRGSTAVATNENTERPTKPFPRRCGHCQEKAVYRETVAYTVSCDHDGRAYVVTIPDLVVPKCRKCGELVI